MTMSGINVVVTSDDHLSFIIALMSTKETQIGHT